MGCGCSTAGRGYDITESKLFSHCGFSADGNHVHLLLYHCHNCGGHAPTSSIDITCTYICSTNTYPYNNKYCVALPFSIWVRLVG